MNKFYEAVIPSNTDHPNGRKTLRTYIAAETKAEAKVKASRFLFQKDGEYGSFYKAPRLEEITEELYISKTEKQLDHVDEWTIKQYCALLSLFGEEENYSEDEIQDAEALLNNPEGEEAEDVARYDALLEKVSTHRGTMEKDATFADIKSAALCLEYACAPSVNLLTNGGKERLAAFEADCAGRGITPLKQEDFDTVCLMRDSARAYPTVASLLENGIAELSLFWSMENGLLLKVRPYWLGEFAGAPFLLDIKTTDDVLDFGKSVEKFGYHLQAAFYEFVMEKVFGLGVDFAFCAISKRQECGRYPVLLGILDEEDGYTGCQLIEATRFHLATGHSHPASGLATVSRTWWAKQADRKRREAQGLMA